VSNEKSNPQPAQVRELRESVQRKQDIGITAAQHLCADMLHTSQRSWRQWETDDRETIGTLLTWIDNAALRVR